MDGGTLPSDNRSSFRSPIPTGAIAVYGGPLSWMGGTVSYPSEVVSDPPSLPVQLQYMGGRCRGSEHSVLPIRRCFQLPSLPVQLRYMGDHCPGWWHSVLPIRSSFRPPSLPVQLQNIGGTAGLEEGVPSVSEVVPALCFIFAITFFPCLGNI